MLDKIQPLVLNIEATMYYDKKRVDTVCPICSNQNWEYVDTIRKPIIDSHLCICKDCGFITYNPQLKDLNKYYENQPRPQSIDFINTKFNKIEKHKKILYPTLKQHFKNEKFSVLDFGASDGYLITALKKDFDLYDDDVKGIELNPGHRNWGKYVNHVEIEGNNDLLKGDKKFDLIICYHVLEHIQNPDKLIASFMRILSPRGLIYFGVPTLDKMEYSNRYSLFKEDHINLFTMNTLKNLLGIYGLGVIHHNPDLYGQAIICKAENQYIHTYINYYQDNLQLLKQIHTCFLHKEALDVAMAKGDLERSKVEALNGLRAFNNYPEFIIKYSGLHDYIDEQDILSEYIKRFPNMYELKIALAMALMKDNNLEEAIVMYRSAIDIVGNDAMCLINIGNCYQHLKEYDKAIEYYQKTLEVSPYNMGAFEMLSSLLTKLP